MNIYWLEGMNLSEKHRSWGRYQKLRYFSQRYKVTLLNAHSPDVNDRMKHELFPELLTSWRQGAETTKPSIASLLWHLIARAKKSDVIYTYSDYGLYIGALLKMLGRLRWVVDINEVPELQLQWLRFEKRANCVKRLLYRAKLISMRTLVRKADLVICLGTSVEEGFPQRLRQQYGVPARAIHPMPIGVDSGSFLSPRHAHERHDHHFNIVYSGAMRRGRGLDNLVVAIARLRELIPAIRLILVGYFADEVERQALHVLVKISNLESTIEYKGHVAHEEALRIVAGADVCVCPFPKLPALEYAYTLKIPEYLAMGKAVIATDLYCNREIIRDGENGILTKGNDPDELCGALYRLYQDSDLRRRLESNARASVEGLEWMNLLSQLEQKMKDTVLRGI